MRALVVLFQNIIEGFDDLYSLLGEGELMNLFSRDRNPLRLMLKWCVEEHAVHFKIEFTVVPNIWEEEQDAAPTNRVK